ncbi:MAG: RND transporter [Firmicutes bacterium HGW-Firmicutes-7]|nr:MAG: RND transporter [Firmicutes bacterium HGW-Firmicutes-7]
MSKSKKNKKLVIIVALVGVITIALTIATLSTGKNESDPLTGYTALSKMELVSSISVSGNIESKNSQSVYSTLNYPVKVIQVSVGDQVSAGDRLAELDTDTLVLDIAQQRSTLESSQKTASIDLENKKRLYENAKNQYDNGLNSELVNAKSSLKTAEIDLQTKKLAFENNKLVFESGGISKEERDQSETNYLNALDTYNRLEVSLKATKLKVEQDIKTAETNLKNAQVSYNNDSQVIALAKLEKTLNDATIKAPISGTVTAVYASVGSSGNGLLFVIEDTNNLIITTFVKEYDAGQVYNGQPVTIKTDATGDEVLNGTVVKISPTSTKDATGATNTSSSTVEFETEVAIVDHNPDLKIGMNTRLNIILEKKIDVYAVPYDAIVENAEGENIIYIITEEAGKKLTTPLIVETGIQTDLHTEISGAGLSDGVLVINNATNIDLADRSDL